MLCAFDLIELNGEDLRRAPIEHRKLSQLVRAAHPGIVVNEHYDGDGEIVFEHACKLRCEGIVSKRLGSPYRSGRSPHWLKIKNSAVQLEGEEDWGQRGKPIFGGKACVGVFHNESIEARSIASVTVNSASSAHNCSWGGIVRPRMAA